MNETNNRTNLPHQNRVTPFGDIIATVARGTLMGNRGCLHNQHRQIKRHFQGKRWIICVLEFKGRWRPIMTPGHYTELFFLDEAVALAAGHRPCAECTRERFNTFRELWARANPELTNGPKPLATLLDEVLQAERITATKQKVTYQEQLRKLPDGAFVTLGGGQPPYLVLGGALLAWKPEGYFEKVARPGDKIVEVLTPRSIVRTLAQGYPVAIHPSAYQL